MWDPSDFLQPWISPVAWHWHSVYISQLLCSELQTNDSTCPSSSPHTAPAQLPQSGFPSLLLHELEKLLLPEPGSSFWHVHHPTSTLLPSPEAFTSKYIPSWVGYAVTTATTSVLVTVTSCPGYCNCFCWPQIPSVHSSHSSRNNFLKMEITSWCTPCSELLGHLGQNEKKKSLTGATQPKWSN